MAGTADAEQLAAELATAHVSVCGLQETRWRGSGARDLGEPAPPGWKLILSGSDTSRMAGVGALLSPAASKALAGSEPISDRLLLLHFKGTVDTTVVVAYAPTNAAPADRKDAFYTQLQLTLQRIPAHRMTIVLGDMNAQVGKDVSSWQGTIGGHGAPSTPQPPWAQAMPAVRRLQAAMQAAHSPQNSPATSVPSSPGSTHSTPGAMSEGQESQNSASQGSRNSGQPRRQPRPRPPMEANNNGRRCLQLCSSNSLLVANTFFQHPDTHTATFISNTGNRWATLDLVLVSRRFRSSVKDTRVLPRATSHPTDHRLVVCDTALRLKAPPKPSAAGPAPYNSAALGDEARGEAYEAALTYALQQHAAAHPQPQSSDAEAMALEAAVQAAAEQHAGRMPRRPRNQPWISPATIALSSRKRAAYEERMDREAALGRLHSVDAAAAEGPLLVVQQAAAAQALAVARQRYRELCTETRRSARADLHQFLRSKAQDMDQAMRACNMQRAFALAAELSGRGRPPKIEALRLADGSVATGDQVAPALARHFEATLNVPTTVAEAQLAAIPASPAAGDLSCDITRAAVTGGGQQQQQQQQQQQREPQSQQPPPPPPDQGTGSSSCSCHSSTR
jgi:exonuclease III